MGLNLYATDISELALLREYADEKLGCGEEYREHEIVLNNQMSSGFYREIKTNDLRISYGDIALLERINIHFDTDFETIEMHFALNGNTLASSKNFDKQVDFRPNQHNIIYANSFKGQMQWQGNNFRFFEVNMTPSFFGRFLPEKDCHLFDEFRKQIQEGRSSLITEQHQTINLKMFEIITEIIQCERKGLFKKIFLETKVVELLLLQLEQLFNQKNTKTSLKRTDVEKMYAVRDFMQDNLSASCSLTDLAHKVGTNEFTLKKGFKELFGTTVFSYWIDLKMTEAKKMLKENDRKISEISDIIGYKNPQHFTSAFKLKYGLLPSQFRRM